jgi:hypothetical protein
MSVTQAFKQLASMRRRPSDNWTIRDVEFLCRNLGLVCKPPARGEHHVVSQPKVEGLLTIPTRRPIKPFYIMLLVQLAESALELE